MSNTPEQANPNLPIADLEKFLQPFIGQPINDATMGALYAAIGDSHFVPPLEYITVTVTLDAQLNEDWEDDMPIPETEDVSLDELVQKAEVTATDDLVAACEKKEELPPLLSPFDDERYD